MKKALSKKNFEKGQLWAAFQDDPRLRYLADLKLGAPLRISHRSGSSSCRYLGIKPDSERPVIVSHAGKVLRAKVSDVLRADDDVLKGTLASGEGFEIHQCLSDADLDCIHSCNHEWVVFSTSLAEVWLMLQCVHCGAHASVNDPTKDEWGEAFYAPEHPYLWVDKSRVTIRGLGPRYVYKAGDEPHSGAVMKDFGKMAAEKRFEETRRAMAWCVGMLHELESHGLVEGDDAFRLTPKGIAEFDQLKASGYFPPEDLALSVLEEVGGDNADMLWRMICKWCEGRD